MTRNPFHGPSTTVGIAPPSSSVSSFNGRTGTVVPILADYDPFFLTPAEGNALYAPIGSTGGGTYGTATINFGTAMPSGRKATATVVVIGQSGILTNSVMNAWVSLTATADHSADEAWIEPLRFSTGNVVAGVGFTVYAICQFGRSYGNFLINWMWK